MLSNEAERENAHLTDAVPMHSNPLRRQMIVERDLHSVILAGTDGRTRVLVVDTQNSLGIAVRRRVDVRYSPNILHHFGTHQAHPCNDGQERHHQRNCPPRAHIDTALTDLHSQLLSKHCSLYGSTAAVVHTVVVGL